MSINNNVVSLFLTNILILFISEIWISETSVNVRNKIMLDMLLHTESTEPMMVATWYIEQHKLTNIGLSHSRTKLKKRNLRERNSFWSKSLQNEI